MLNFIALGAIAGISALFSLGCVKQEGDCDVKNLAKAPMPDPKRYEPDTHADPCLSSIPALLSQPRLDQRLHAADIAEVNAALQKKGTFLSSSASEFLALQRLYQASQDEAQDCAEIPVFGLASDPNLYLANLSKVKNGSRMGWLKSELEFEAVLYRQDSEIFISQKPEGHFVGAEGLLVRGILAKDQTFTDHLGRRFVLAKDSELIRIGDHLVRATLAEDREIDGLWVRGIRSKLGKKTIGGQVSEYLQINLDVAGRVETCRLAKPLKIAGVELPFNSQVVFKYEGSERRLRHAEAPAWGNGEALGNRNIRCGDVNVYQQR